jgi:glucose-6-phosphate 1-epimerase
MEMPMKRTAPASIAVEPGEGGLHRIVLSHPRGGRAELYLHGAHLASWRDASGDELLFLSRQSRFDAKAAIRGGVPVIFPQFADQGPLPKHGFARTSAWTVEGQSATDQEAVVTLRLADSEGTRAIWDHAFRADLTVRLDDALRMELAVENAGAAPMELTCALHTYFRVEDVRRASVLGLAGVRYRDKVKDGAESTQSEEALEIAGETDRVYMDAPATLRIRDEAGGRTIVIERAGFADAVVWNPWTDLARQLPDLGDDDYLRMLCVESANAATPVRLEPGARWIGTQVIRREG